MTRARMSATAAVAAALLIPLTGAGAASAAPHYESAPIVQVGHTDSATPRKPYDLVDQDARLGSWSDARGRTHTSRVYATFDLAPFAGKNIVSGLLTVEEGTAADCTKRAIEVWETDPVTTTPTWQTAPAQRRLLDDIRTSSYCPARISFDVSSALTNAGGTVTFVLRVPAELEGDPSYGRTLSWYASAKLTVGANAAPVIEPRHRYHGGFACDDTAPTRTLGSFPGVLQALATDADDATIDYEFAVWPQDDPAARLTLTSSKYLNAGTVTPPSGYLTDGRVYSWQARATDRVDTSEWTQPCSFVADTVRPTTPTVTSTPEAVFTFSGNGNTDVKAFQYAWGQLSVPGCVFGQYGLYRCEEPFAGSNVVFPDVPGGSVTLPIAPPNPATNYLEVRAIDAAGQGSPSVRYEYPPGD